MTSGRIAWAVTGMLALGMFSTARAGVVVYQKDHKKIELGGRIQLQYLNTDPDNSQSRDQVFFRRLRPYIAGTVSENWMGKIQFDFGKSSDGDEVAVKDAYMRYTGVEAQDLTITIGNSKAVFSREFLTSSKRQQLVERTFVGDHNFATPDRQLGVRVDGKIEDGWLSYAGSVGAQHHDPAAGRMDFDTPVNNAGDWNEGLLVSGRVDFHPLGAMKFDQGDFGGESFRFTVGLAAFLWNNDNDNDTYTDAVTGLSSSTSKIDLDNAIGLALSGGGRGHGVSFDVEIQRVEGETIDPFFTGGLYRNGTTDLDKIAVEGGYMVLKNRLEVVAGWESLDADNYADAWTRISVGINWFLNKHKTKLQATYRKGDNVAGVKDADVDTGFVQAQFVF